MSESNVQIGSSAAVPSGEWFNLSTVAEELPLESHDQFCPGMDAVVVCSEGGSTLYFRKWGDDVALMVMYPMGHGKPIARMVHPSFKGMQAVRVIPIDCNRVVLMASLVEPKPVDQQSSRYSRNRSSVAGGSMTRNGPAGTAQLAPPNDVIRLSRSLDSDGEGAATVSQSREKSVTFVREDSGCKDKELEVDETRLKFLRFDSMRPQSRSALLLPLPSQESPVPSHTSSWIYLEVFDHVTGDNGLENGIRRLGRQAFSIDDWFEDLEINKKKDLNIVSFNSCIVDVHPDSGAPWIIAMPTVRWIGVLHSSNNELYSDSTTSDTTSDSPHSLLSGDLQVHSRGFFSEESESHSEDCLHRRMTRSIFDDTVSSDSVSSEASIEGEAPIQSGCPYLYLIPLSGVESEKRIIDLSTILSQPSCTHIESIALYDNGGRIDGLIVIYDCEKNLLSLYNWIMQQFLGSWDFRDITAELIPEEELAAGRCACKSRNDDVTTVQQEKRGFAVGVNGVVYVIVATNYILSVDLTVTDGEYTIELQSYTCFEGFTGLGLSALPNYLAVSPDDSVTFFLGLEDLGWYSDTSSHQRLQLSPPNGSIRETVERETQHTTSVRSVLLTHRGTGALVQEIHEKNDPREPRSARRLLWQVQTNEISASDSSLEIDGRGHRIAKDCKFITQCPGNIEWFTSIKGHEHLRSVYDLQVDLTQSMSNCRTDTVASSVDGKYFASVVALDGLAYIRLINIPKRSIKDVPTSFSSVDAISFWRRLDHTMDIVVISGTSIVSYSVIIGDEFVNQTDMIELESLSDLNGQSSPPVHFLSTIEFENVPYLFGITLRKATIYIWSPINGKITQTHVPDTPKAAAWGFCVLQKKNVICTIDHRGVISEYNWISHSTRSYSIAPILTKNLGINGRLNWIQNLIPTENGLGLIWGWKYHRPREINAIALIDISPPGEPVVRSVFQTAWAPQLVSSHHMMMQKISDHSSSTQVNQMVDIMGGEAVLEWPCHYKWTYSLRDLTYTTAHELSVEPYQPCSVGTSYSSHRDCVHCFGSRGIIVGDGTNAQLLSLPKRCADMTRVTV